MTLPNFSSVALPIILAIGACIATPEAKASVIINDSFNDGNIGTNSLGIGSGFQKFTQTDGINSSTVVEAGGAAVLGTGATCVYCISDISSKDTFSFFSPAGVTRVIWSLGGTTFSPNAKTRDYLTVVASNFQSYDSRLNPHDSNAPGLYLRLEDPEPFNGHVFGFMGGIVVEDGTGSSDELATWSWTGVWDRVGPLEIILDLSNTGFAITIDGNLGSTTASGNWSSIVSATNFVSALHASSAVVGAQNQGLFGIGSTLIDSISVSTIPEPGTFALISLSLIGLGASRRREGLASF